MAVLVLFHRDLRATDHPALTHAAALAGDCPEGRQGVLPLYIVDPHDWAAGAASARQWSFTAESLEGLRQQLAARGAPLVVRVGPEMEVLRRMVRGQEIRRIVMHKAPWRGERQAQIAAWAREEGVEVDLLEEGREALPAPALQAISGVEPGMIPPPKALGLEADPAPHRQQGGRDWAMARLTSFGAGRAVLPMLGAQSPISGERSDLRLSAHLAIGAVSAREVTAALPEATSVAVVRRLSGRLALRGRLMRQATPETAEPLAKGLHVSAFLQGQTGIPFADACLRYWRATGWINAAGRSMLASVGAHHLGLEARVVGQLMARLSTDYHPALLWGALPFALSGRVTDPVRLGEDHDAQAQFIRRWLPELGAVPQAHLHRPWRWEGAASLLGRRYPEPLVDPFTALRQARARPRSSWSDDDSFEVIEGGARPFVPSRQQGPVQLRLEF